MSIDSEIFPLTLPRALLDQAIRRARVEAVSLQQFISQAIEEKIMLSGRSTQSWRVPPRARLRN
jgi:hypothetical protein